MLKGISHDFQCELFVTFTDFIAFLGSTFQLLTYIIHNHFGKS